MNGLVRRGINTIQGKLRYCLKFLKMGYPTQKNIRQDKEANYFVRCLLIPEKFLIPEIEKLKTQKILTTENLIKLLAKRFKVPEYQMAIRLTELKIIF